MGILRVFKIFCIIKFYCFMWVRMILYGYNILWKKIGCLVIKIISYCVWDDFISRGYVLNVFRNDH